MPNSKALLLAATVLGLGSTPVWAQETGTASADQVTDTAADDDAAIVVTARRREELLQDVPISITVFSSQDLANNNITTAKDVTIYTPGLVAQGRNGNDNIAFTIRGFSQEIRTTATVGTYFADVVMPRGSGASGGGDGAGPGHFFDLENVQVLKGPQGTLFGRNSTGGAILLVPRKPTDRFEGYVEASAGNYDMYRLQSVVNVPLADGLRMRLGVDHLKRDGHLKDVGNLGTGKYGDGMGSSDYWALRFSLVADLSPDIEHYLVASYTDSKSSPPIPKIIKAWNAGAPGTVPCAPPATTLQCGQFLREAPFGGWAVSNSLADTQSLLRQWQIINTTRWQVDDNLVVKNIFSLAEFRNTANQDLFGGYWLVDGTPFGTERPDQVLTFAYTHAEPAKGRTNAQRTLVEELQFQGNADDGRLVWQGGFYLELSNPLHFSGVQTAVFTPCTDINTFNCRPTASGPGIAGQGSFSISETKFRGRAIYGQASYDITDNLKVTAGLRYTWDKMSTILHNVTWRVRPAFLPPAGLSFICTNPTAPGFGQVVTDPAQRYSMCRQNLRQSSSAPTWLLGLDFKPWDDALLYAKWSRGYRQGGLTIFGADPLQPYGEERVDTYEIGSKISWRGSVPGIFNISAYYNDFQDQQLQAGVNCEGALAGRCAPSTIIINAGTSRLYGFEAELGISPFEGLRIHAAYAYLNTKITEIPTAADLIALLPPGSLYNVFILPSKGDKLNFAMPHKATVTVSYELPLSQSVGKVRIGGTYVYQSKYRAVTDACRSLTPPLTPCDDPSDPGFGNGIIPSAQIVNLSVNWEDVFQLPLDASFFMTNVFNERYYLHVNDNLTRNFLSAMVAEPRMWGARLRYKFGD